MQLVIELGFHSSPVEVCEINVLSGFRVHSSIPKSEVSALIVVTPRFAKKVMVEPSATVGLGLTSDAIHDVSYDSLFAALKLSASKQGLVGPVKETGCKVIDPGSHVQRVLTRSDGKVEKDRVTLDEEKGEFAYVDAGRDVGHVTAIHKNPDRSSSSGTPVRFAYKDVRKRMRIEAHRQKELDEGVEAEVVLDSFLNQVKVEKQQQSGPLKRVVTPSAKAAKHRRARDKKLRETLCWWIANDKVCPHGDRCNFRHTVSETGALLRNPAPEQTMCETGGSWPSLATEQDKSETGVLSPSPSTNPPQSRSPTRDSWNNSWDRYDYRDKWTDVWKDGHDGNRWIHGWNEHYHGDNWTDAWRERNSGFVQQHNDDNSTDAWSKCKSDDEWRASHWETSSWSSSHWESADGTMQTSAATIAKNRCGQVIHFSRQRA